MTRISTLIAAAAFAGFGLSAQASVPPSAPVADAAATTLAMGPGPWCGAPQDSKKGSTGQSGQTGGCEKVARASRS